jgi:hypothetical protein
MRVQKPGSSQLERTFLSQQNLLRIPSKSKAMSRDFQIEVVKWRLNCLAELCQPPARAARVFSQCPKSGIAWAYWCIRAEEVTNANRMQPSGHKAAMSCGAARELPPAEPE